MKDFAAEIRASLDVENFLNQAQLILDMGESNMEAIIDKLLHHLLSTEENSSSLIDEAKKSLFTHDSGKYSNVLISLNHKTCGVWS